MNASLQLRKAAFLDRDGVINVDRHYLVEPEQFEFIDGVFAACQHLQSLGYLLIVVTNQSGIARGFYSEDQFNRLTRWMTDQFSMQGIALTQVYYCPHYPGDGAGPYQRDCDCRKPRPGMLLRAIAEHAIDPALSLMVGDKAADMQAAAAAGVARKVLVRSGQPLSADDLMLADEVWPSLREALERVSA